MAGDACIAPTNNRENIGNYTLTVGSMHASTVPPFSITYLISNSEAVSHLTSIFQSGRHSAALSAAPTLSVLLSA